MSRERDRREVRSGPSRERDALEAQAEQDLAAMKTLIQRTRAEMARSRKLAESIERRTKRGEPDRKK